MRVDGTFLGRLSSFAEVRDLAEAFGAAAGVDPATTLRVVLVLEELFTNTVTHGYSAGADGPIWLALVSQGGAVEVTYEDAGPPFDPLTAAPAPPDFSSGLADQLPGGLGLALVRGLTTAARYARVGNRNRLTLTVAPEGSSTPASAS